MPKNNTTHPTQLALRFPQSKPIQSWWGPVWRGLIVDSKARHYRALRTALWLYVYFIIHADRRRGHLIRKISTIAVDMGVGQSSVRRWLSALHQGGYITKHSTGRAIEISINRWKPLRRRQSQPTNNPKHDQPGPSHEPLQRMEHTFGTIRRS